MRDGKGLRAKEQQDFLEGRYIGGGRSSFHGKEMDEAKMFGDEDILVTFVKFSSSFKYLAYRTLVLLPAYSVTCMIVFAMIVFTVACMHDSNVVLCCS